MPFLRVPILLVLSAALLRADAPPPADPKALIDSLNQAQMQEIFRVLQQRYIKPEILNDDELNRAALQGLFARLELGASLVEHKKDERAAIPAGEFLSEELTESIAYLRPAAFTIEELPRLDVALDGLSKGKAHTLLLDLRNPAPDGDFIAAAQFVSRFVPDGQPLFSVRSSGEPKARPFVSKGKPRWSRKVILLVDPDCNNIAETIAAVLQKHLKPIIVGSKTQGRAVQYQEVSIGPNKALRFAAAEVILEGGATLFRNGITPEIEASADLEAKRKVFAASAKEGMKKFIFEHERPRMNEAALVAQTNPELEYQIAKSAQQKTAWDETPLQDRVVQQTIDFLTAAEKLQKQPAPEKPKKKEEQVEERKKPTEADK